MGGEGHELSILIRLGDEGRLGRSPSNVSTMIIRPLQHGHRCAGESISVSLSASAGGRSGAASNWRTRPMLCARTVPTVVADAVEAARQDVQEKAADELVGRERHRLEPVAALDPVVLPLEGDALLVEAR